MQDLIERRAALTALCEDCKTKYNGLCPHPDSRCVEFRTIKQLPAIDAEPVRHGRWIRTMLKGYYECSACGYEHTSNPDQRFCSYCGAKMYQTGGTISKERFAEIMRGDDNG